jgi:hypothetical protein
VGRRGGASRNDRDAWGDLGHGSLSAFPVRLAKLDQRPDVLVQPCRLVSSVHHRADRSGAVEARGRTGEHGQ